MSGNVLVAGATGFIGTRVCAVLTEKNYKVFALVLPGCITSHIREHVKEFIEGDLADQSIVENLYNKILNQNIQYIISIVGSVDYNQDYDTSYRINVETTRNITQLALGLHEENKLKKYVYTGSVASRGFLKKSPVEDLIINEERDYYKKGVSVYSDIKRECENYVNSIAKFNSMNAVIIEPGSLIGEGIGNTTTTNTGLIKKITRGFPVLKGGASYTSVKRVAEGIVLAMENGRNGETYLLGGENISMKELAFFVRSILEQEFPDIKKTSLPVMKIPKIISYLLGKMNLIINNQQALLGNAWHFIDSSKARDELGYVHSREDLEKAIKRVINSFL